MFVGGGVVVGGIVYVVAAVLVLVLMLLVLLLLLLLVLVCWCTGTGAGGTAAAAAGACRLPCCPNLQWSCYPKPFKPFSRSLKRLKQQCDRSSSISVQGNVVARSQGNPGRQSFQKQGFYGFGMEFRMSRSNMCSPTHARKMKVDTPLFVPTRFSVRSRATLVSPSYHAGSSVNGPAPRSVAVYTVSFT